MASLPNGLPDLGALKASKERRELILTDRLTKLGLVCLCGERIRSTGMQVLFIGDAMVPGPSGLEPALKIGSAAFCGPDCAEFQTALQNPEAALTRPLEPVTWLDEG
jgi:hypothetical protein